MAVLRSIESKIEGLFEGVFGRAFRTHVQPIELARKLAKEMDDHRNVSVSRVYVPNEYTLYLSPDDRKQFDGYEESLVGELQEYLAEHARREQYALLDTPRVLVTTDDDLAVGEFGIATRLVAAEGSRRERRPARACHRAPAQTMIYKAPVPATPDEPRSSRSREVVTLTVAGRKHEVTERSTVLGRSRECRRPPRRRQRLPPPCRAAPGGSHVLDRRPRLDERPRGQRQAREAGAAAGRRPDHDGLDRDRLRARAADVSLLAIETDETLLILKIAFLVLLYGFIVLVVRSATRGMEQAPPQESIMLGAAEAAQLRAEHGLAPAKLLVLTSPELAAGRTLEVAAPDGHRTGRAERDPARSGRVRLRAVTHGSSRVRTASGSTTSARRTAPS